ncbi:MAG: nucleoside hydrolase [Erysipelotrichaceae bacterium]|nr:nucleoside hydrolase [Erysipelotrichaceae bacterium]
MDKIKVWFDTDTGIDDGMALLLLCHLDVYDVKGISAVAGNSTIENTFRNARDVVSLAKREDIKVFRGSDKPLEKKLLIAPEIHGENGIGGAILEPSKAPVETMDAIDALYQCALANKGELVVMAVGPLTNIAKTILKYPDFKDLVKEFAIMGGAIVGGNRTPYAEYNIYADPLAAKIVFATNVKLNMFGLDVTAKALISREETESLGRDNPVGKYINESVYNLMELMNSRGYGYVEAMHDSCPVMYYAYPDLFKLENYPLIVIDENGDKEGKTAIDQENGNPNCYAAMKVDKDRMVKLSLDIYRSI